MINLNDSANRVLARDYGRVIKVVKNLKLGVAANIYFNKKYMTFSAHLNGDSRQDADVTVVESWAEAQLQTAVALTWQPVIHVLDVGSHNNITWNRRKLNTRSVSIDICRFWMAAKPDGGIRAADWEVPAAERLTSQAAPFNWPEHKAEVANSKIVLPLHDETSHVFAYTEERWLGLTQLCAGIDALQQRLIQLLGSDAGLLKIEDVGRQMQRLLTEPTNAAPSRAEKNL